ncbi:MAG: IS30 family transposase [Ghiorsea sp.]|nr:IS30 family transposase [Ghiorsea sp.]
MGKHYTHLNNEERSLIQVSLELGQSQADIARSLKRPRSCISRELVRNSWKKPSIQRRSRGRPAIAGGYRSVDAQQRAMGNVSQARNPKRLIPESKLWDEVIPLLQDFHSPEQISGILKRMYPDDKSMQVSHETIYRAIYAIPRGALRKELIACLRQSRKSRRPRTRGEDRRGSIPNMVSIHDRPLEIEERIIPGHWEGDLIKGARNASSIGTLVERTSLFVTLVKLDSATAKDVEQGFAHVLNRIDAQKRLSMTYDQGREMAWHKLLATETGIKVYFADPHSPWQRGRNENTNGLLRQYLPKGTDLSVCSQQELDEIAWKLNTRPRKSLNFRCPAEIFMPESFDFHKHFARVALGT